MGLVDVIFLREMEGPGIHSACWHGTVEVVKILLDFKAKLEVQNFQQKLGEIQCWKLEQTSINYIIMS